MMKYLLIALFACCVAAAFAAEDAESNVTSGDMVAEEHRLGYYGYGRPHYYGGHYRRPHYYQPRYQHGYYRGRRSTDEVTYPEPSAVDVSDADQNTEEYRRGYYGGYYRPRYAGYYGYRPYFYGRPHWAY